MSMHFCPNFPVFHKFPLMNKDFTKKTKKYISMMQFLSINIFINNTIILML